MSASEEAQQQLPAWATLTPGTRRIVAANLILEYTLSVAAVGRSASGYFATLLGATAVPVQILLPLLAVHLHVHKDCCLPAHRVWPHILHVPHWAAAF